MISFRNQIIFSIVTMALQPLHPDVGLERFAIVHSLGLKSLIFLWGLADISW